jgi:hypothetical protein
MQALPAAYVFTDFPTWLGKRIMFVLACHYPVCHAWVDSFGEDFYYALINIIS